MAKIVKSKKVAVRSKKITKVSLPVVQEQTVKKRASLVTPKNIIVIAILLGAIFIWKFRGKLIAATVNGQPISRMELNDQLAKKFGTQTLDNLINERLILSAARTKGIFLTAPDIDTRIKDIEKKLEGRMTLDDALKLQGLSREDFKRQIEIQLSIEKMFDNDASVSAAEIEDYLSKNSTALKSSTDPAALKEEVKNTLKQQKVSELFDKWFAEVRKNAKIQKFI